MKDAYWSFLAIYLRQAWNKEQKHTVLAPASPPPQPSGNTLGRAEQNEQSLVVAFPPRHHPRPRVVWKLKYPQSM